MWSKRERIFVCIIASPSCHEGSLKWDEFLKYYLVGCNNKKGLNVMWPVRNITILIRISVTFWKSLAEFGIGQRHHHLCLLSCTQTHSRARKRERAEKTRNLWIFCLSRNNNEKANKEQIKTKPNIHKVDERERNWPWLKYCICYVVINEWCVR